MTIVGLVIFLIAHFPATPQKSTGMVIQNNFVLEWLAIASLIAWIVRVSRLLRLSDLGSSNIPRICIGLMCWGLGIRGLAIFPKTSLLVYFVGLFVMILTSFLAFEEHPKVLLAYTCVCGLLSINSVCLNILFQLPWFFQIQLTILVVILQCLSLSYFESRIDDKNITFSVKCGIFAAFEICMSFLYGFDGIISLSRFLVLLLLYVYVFNKM